MRLRAFLAFLLQPIATNGELAPAKLSSIVDRALGTEMYIPVVKGEGLCGFCQIKRA